MFSVGAGLCAFFALAGLSVPNIALLFGLVSAVLAFRGPYERRQGRLMMAGVGLAVWLFFVTVIWYALAFGTLAQEISEENAFFVTWSREGPFVVLDVIRGVALTLAALLTTVAFHRQDDRRFRVLSWSGWCIALYYLLDLPRAIRASAAPPSLGAYWTEPAAYLSILLGVLAGLAISRAFAWYTAPRTSGDRLPFADREYLLSVAAFSLAVPRLVGLALLDWSVIERAAGEAISTAAIVGVVYLSMVLLLPTLFLTGAVGFYLSSRQTGRRPSRLQGSQVNDQLTCSCHWSHNTSVIKPVDGDREGTGLIHQVSRTWQRTITNRRPQRLGEHSPGPSHDIRAGNQIAVDNGEPVAANLERARA